MLRVTLLALALLIPLQGAAAPIDELPPEISVLQLDGDSTDPLNFLTSFGGFIVDVTITPTLASMGVGVLEATIGLGGIGRVEAHAVPIPQPRTAALFSLGLIGLALSGRRR